MALNKLFLFKNKFLLKFCNPIFAFVLIYLLSFTPSYPVGDNIDDKSYYLLSSKLVELSNEARQEVYNKYIKPLDLPTRENNRYKFRINSIGNTLLPSWLMRISYKLYGEGEKELSLAFYTGYLVPFLIAISSIIFSRNFISPDFKQFYDIYIVTLLLLIPLKFSQLESIDLLLSNNFAPGASPPRSTAALLAPVLFISFIDRKYIFSIFNSILITLTHASSSLFLHFTLLPLLTYHLFTRKKYNIDLYLLTILLTAPLFLVFKYNVFPSTYFGEISNYINFSGIFNLNFFSWLIAIATLFLFIFYLESNVSDSIRSLLFIAITLILLVLTVDLFSNLNIIVNRPPVLGKEIVSRLLGLSVSFLITLIVFMIYNIRSPIKFYAFNIIKFINFIIISSFVILSILSFQLRTENISLYASKLYSYSILRIYNIKNDYSTFLSKTKTGLSLPLDPLKTSDNYSNIDKPSEAEIHLKIYGDLIR